MLFNLNLQKMKILVNISSLILAGNLVRKWPLVLNKLNNNSTKHYYINIKKNCHNFEPCNVVLGTIKKILVCQDTLKALGLDWTEYLPNF